MGEVYLDTCQSRLSRSLYPSKSCYTVGSWWTYGAGASGWWVWVRLTTDSVPSMSSSLTQSPKLESSPLTRGIKLIMPERHHLIFDFGIKRSCNKPSSWQIGFVLYGLYEDSTNQTCQSPFADHPRVLFAETANWKSESLGFFQAKIAELTSFQCGLTYLCLQCALP